MPTDATQATPVSTYAMLLIEARIAALKALTDILATSDDPTERRLAATAILRTPDPGELPSSRSTNRPHATKSSGSDRASTSHDEPVAGDGVPDIIDATPLPILAAHTRDALVHAGISVGEQDNPFTILDSLPSSTALPIVRAVRAALTG